MKILDISTTRPNMSGTKTYEDYHKFLGAAPHRLGLQATQYPWLTASYLTEGLMNVFYNNTKGSKYQPINQFAFDWDIDVNYIRRVEFVAVPQGTGANGSDIVFAFKERYYEKYDKFRIEGSRQDIYVHSAPIRRADTYWEVIGTLIDPEQGSVLDVNACQPGMRTRWMGNAVPEASEEGFVKYQSNVERHRNYISTHRNDVDWTSEFAATEDVFIQIASGKDQQVKVYTMKKKEQELLETWMENRNLNLLFSKSCMDKNGKSTIIEPRTGRPIIMGDGLIPQIERYAYKYFFNFISESVFQDVMGMMRQKAKAPQGNDFIFICNENMYDQVQRSLGKTLVDMKTNGAYFFSTRGNQAKPTKINVGSTFDCYEFAGNTISFKVDKTLSHEYPDRAYAICLDMTPNMTEGKPAMQMFTIRGREFIKGYLKGVGGLDGISSGEVSTPVAASKLIYMGSAAVAYFNPYRACIMQGPARKF